MVRSDAGNHRRKQARWPSIVDGAARVFAERGYASTNMAQICSAVGLGKGGLYYYIDTKEDLLVEIQERFMGPLIQESRTILAFPVTATAKLRLLSELLLTVQYTRLDHSRVILHEYGQLSGERHQRFAARRDEYEGILDTVLEAGAHTGELDVPDVPIARLTFLGMHNYTYTWLNPQGRLGPIELSAAYCGILLHGLAADGTPTADTIDAQLDQWRSHIPTLTRSPR